MNYISSRDIIKIANKYHRLHWEEKEIKSWAIYNEVVIDRKFNLNDPNLIESAIKFLGAWNALRFKGGKRKFKKVSKNWLKENYAILEEFEYKELKDLNGNDLTKILILSGTLRDAGIPSTCFGKFLHFLLPNVILLWDQEIVRNNLDLNSDPYSFINYHCFGINLCSYLTIREGKEIIKSICDEHFKCSKQYPLETNNPEPITRIIDELVHYQKNVRWVTEKLGGREKAFDKTILLNF